MSRKLIYILMLFIILQNASFAFDNKYSHKIITEESVFNSRLDEGVLKSQLGIDDGIKKSLYNRGKEQTIAKWLQQGSQEEDEPSCRASNHFHNPLISWDRSGLTDPKWIVDVWCELTSPFRTKHSNISWATGFSDNLGNLMPSNVNGVAASTEQNGRNWFVARKLFYSALTAENAQQREELLAETFRTLGYVLHLLQDMAVPAHTRNDFSQGHTQFIGCPDGDIFCGKEWIGNPFEGYVRDNLEQEVLPLLAGNISTRFTGEKALTNFWDTTYLGNANDIPQTHSDIGLAEYTNGNFVSYATIFQPETNTVHYFPFPNRDSISDEDYPDDQLDERLHKIYARDGKLDKGVYIAKNKHGEVIDKFIKPRYILYGAEEVRWDLKFTLDDQCYLEYAKKLIPRAVGYSATLLDYFFRGKIDIQEPKLTFGENASITGINCSIKNMSPPIEEGQKVEEFLSGAIELVYSYMAPDPANPSSVKRYYKNIKDIHTISGAADPINFEYIDISADLKDNPIPAGAYDISFTVVFKGTLGSEQEAVTAQIYEFNNSRIAYLYQPGGQPHTSNIYTVSPDGSHPYQLTNATNPNPWYFAPAWSNDGTKMAFEDHSCAQVDSDGLCPMDDYFRDIVVIDILSELPYPNNILCTLNNDGKPVANPSFSPDGNHIAALAMNTNGLIEFSNIVLLDVQNGTARQLTEYDPQLTDLYGSTPAWSPGGDEIAYYLYRIYDETNASWQDKRDIIVISADGGAQRTLTNDTYNNTQPSWSPDGEWIVFSSDRDGAEAMDIWLMDKNGNNKTQLVDCGNASCYSPSFSPDGQYVAFGNGGSIYISDRQGLNSFEEIANPGALTGSISWSPFLTPPFLSAEATPSTITSGESVVLSWESNRAKEVFINGVSGSQSVTGSVVVTPEKTTTYILQGIGSYGIKEVSVTVEVK
ncbi:PD40 domain-containing protein [Desulfogranum japonicum]|uniref:PD40 domain-containing protein n=1 Tax=Desulfogranum japonicum TaxID=231447 RepID=UPI0004060D9B|nr:PD40 domain-containing protein [Desulfogranum japonicum]